MTGLPSRKNRALLQPSGRSGGTLSYFVAFLSANKQKNKDFIFVTFKDIVCSKEEKVLTTFFFSLLTGRKRISNDMCVCMCDIIL